MDFMKLDTKLIINYKILELYLFQLLLLIREINEQEHETTNEQQQQRTLIRSLEEKSLIKKSIRNLRNAKDAKTILKTISFVISKMLIY